MSDSLGAEEPYAIDWTATAWRRLNRLPEKAGAALIGFVHGPLAENPRRVGHELHLDLAGQWSARRHPYRVTYTIDDESRTVTIETVGHRRDVYRAR